MESKTEKDNTKATENNNAQENGLATNSNPTTDVKSKHSLKNTFISIPFILLIVFIMLSIVGNLSLILGVLGIVEFAFIDPAYELFFSFCTLIGPLMLVTYGYAKLAKRTGINFKLLTFWVFVIIGGFVVGLNALLDLTLPNYVQSPQYVSRLSHPSTYVYMIFMLIGIFGIAYSRYETRNK